MSITRKATRQAASQWQDLAIVSTASGGGAQSLLAAKHPFQDGSADDGEHKGWWLLKLPGAANEETRRVSETTRVDGSYVHAGPAWTVNPASADEFELHRYDPATWNRAITLTLSKCWYVDREFIPAVTDQTEYSLTSYSWIADEERVKNVYQVIGDTLLELFYEPWAYGSRWWRLTRNASGVIVLEISPPFGTLPTATLSGSHNASIQTLTMVSTSGLPSPGALVAESEIIFYTGKTATTFTGCTRGSLGTTAATHADAVTVREAKILCIEGVRPYADLTTDSDASTGTTTCPDDLVVWGTRYHMAMLLGLVKAGRGTSQGDATPSWAILAAQEYRRLLRAYAPKYSLGKIQFSTPYSGAAPLF